MRSNRVTGFLIEVRRQRDHPYQELEDGRHVGGVHHGGVAEPQLQGHLPHVGLLAHRVFQGVGGAVVRKVSGGLDPECEEVGEQLFAFLISLLHR